MTHTSDQFPLLDDQPTQRVWPRVTLMLMHLVVAAAVLSYIYSSYAEICHATEKTQTQAAQATQNTARIERDVKIHQAILKAIHRDDPYIIEKIAREKFGYRGHNELSPPKMMTSAP